MALLKRWMDDGTDLSAPEAYHRIDGVTLNTLGKEAQFSVLVFKDQAARRRGKAPFITRSFAVRNIAASESADGEAHNDFDDLFSLAALDREGVNPVSQAYAWLKTHPLYSGATDA